MIRHKADILSLIINKFNEAGTELRRQPGKHPPDVGGKIIKKEASREVEYDLP